jgi:hypothetical protein
VGLYISTRVREKLLSKHQVTEGQIIQCFANRTGRDLFDTRPEHRTDPPTRWFIAQTDYGIKLKICFIYDPTTELVEIKSAFSPNEEEIRIYKKYG